MLPPMDRNVQMQLFEANRDAELTLSQSMAAEANRMARILAPRELPDFYFTEAGNEIGVSSKTVRDWKLNAYPIPQGGREETILYRTNILIRVYLRLKNAPEGETYLQAMLRLQARIGELLDLGFTRNQIAQQLLMSFRTLKDLIERDHLRETEANRKTTHCPWSLLARLSRAEEEIDERVRQQPEMQDRRILHEGLDFNNPADELELPPPGASIKIGDDCGKCGAGWPNLREDGEDAWNRPVMVCMICGSENALDTDPGEPEEADFAPPPEEEFIERYACCRECRAYWNHMKKDRTDRWNNTVYICLRCTAVNRVSPKRTPARNL